MRKWVRRVATALGVVVLAASVIIAGIGGAKAQSKQEKAPAQAAQQLRRLGPQLWFDEATTEAGRDALGFYHERKDETRNIGLGPEHDWSSHAADALGLMAICYEQPARAKGFNRSIRYEDRGWR